MANNVRAGDIGENVKTVVPTNPVGNETDPFKASYADPNLLEPDWSAMYQAQPFDSQPANLIGDDISTVDPLAGIQTPGFAPVQVQNIEADLLMVRAEMPFLPILRWPTVTKTVFMAVANTAADILIPSGAVLVKLSGPSDWYASFQGQAQVPSATVNGDAGSLYKPDDAWYYCGGKAALSVVAPAVNGIVTARFIMRPSPNQGT